VNTSKDENCSIKDLYNSNAKLIDTNMLYQLSSSQAFKRGTNAENRANVENQHDSIAQLQETIELLSAKNEKL
jgi:hypothetical protein